MENKISKSVWRSFSHINRNDVLLKKKVVVIGEPSRSHHFHHSHFDNVILSRILCILL
jgi:hypothetical protein